jgi:hypothetical protein
MEKVSDMYSAGSPPSSGGTNSHVDTDGERNLLLQALRIAHRQFQIAINVIDAIGVALKGRLIDSDTALAWLHDEALIDFIELEPPAPEQKSEAA